MSRVGAFVVARVRCAVLDWNLRLVAGLPEDVARDRSAQIESDLWEQAATARRAGRDGIALAVAVGLRCLRGIPADLTWSFRLRAASPAIRRIERSGMAGRSVPAREWVHLEGPPPFDQTNGLVAFGSDRADDREADAAAALLAKGLASNAVNVGTVGGNL